MTKQFSLQATVPMKLQCFHTPFVLRIATVSYCDNILVAFVGSRQLLPSLAAHNFGRTSGCGACIVFLPAAYYGHYIALLRTCFST
jgi:hypothetical protein